MCGEKGGILLGLHGVRVRAEKETIFFLFPDDQEIPMGFSLRRLLRLLNTNTSLSLVDTAILEQCLNGLPQFEMKSCLFPAAMSEILRNSICIFFWCF